MTLIGKTKPLGTEPSLLPNNWDDFVNWEIEYASNHDTRVVAVYLQGENGVELPEAAKEFADAVVGWNADSIVAAIEGENCWEEPDGSPRPVQNLARHNC